MSSTIDYHPLKNETPATMYWKFKLPLIAILLLILVTLIVFTVKSFQQQPATPEPAPQAVTAQAPQPAPTPVPEVAPPQEPAPQTVAPVQTPKAFTVNEIPDSAQSEATPEPPKPEVVATPEPPKPEVVVTPPEPPKPEVITPPQPVVEAKPEPEPAPVATDAAESLLKRAAELSASKPLEARALAHQVLKMPGVNEYDPTWRRAAKIISDINSVFVNTSAPCPEKKAYTVQSGDVLVRIAYRLKTTVQALMNMNENLNPRRLYVGKKLAYLDGTWSIKVSKSQFLLTLYRDGTLYRIYTVGIGRDNRTPVGVFKVRDKVIDPAWDSPEGRIPPNDPRNILGTRWMGLEAIEETSPYLTGYGIHGTTLPDTVGTPSSAGCVRLRNEEVNDLYNIIPEPQANTTRVTISE